MFEIQINAMDRVPIYTAIYILKKTLSFHR